MMLHILLAFFIYVLSGIAAALLMLWIYQQNIWYGYETFYKLLHFLDRNRSVFITGYLLTGLFAICLYNMKKLFRYLEQIIDATGELFKTDDQLITLPKDLSEIELRMNGLKLQVQKNQRAAKDAEQRKNDLVVYLAHDLKTPLTSVIGYLTLLQDEPQISDEIRSKYLTIALDKAERLCGTCLEDLINEFFEITRFSLTHLTLERSKINLTRMLEQTIYEFAPMFQEKDLQCHLSTEDNLMLRCDPEKLQRVFDNLLRNAVNYSYEHSSILIHVTHDETQLSLVMENQGPAIPQEKLERIFEQFFRLDSARTSRNGGSGLGLAIAKEIVELHQGTITAESHDNTISFHVALPFSS